MRFEQDFLPLPGVHNIRDLGGLPRAGGGATAHRRVMRGCAMRGLAPAGRAALIEAGLGTVIDLRAAAERAEAPSPFAGTAGIEDIHLPLFEDLAPLVQMMAGDAAFTLDRRYGAALDAAAPRFAAAIAAVADAGPGIVLFHCTAGKDRTGLIAALLLVLAGVPRDAIAADYARTATDGAALIDSLRVRALAAGADPQMLGVMLSSPAEAMAATLDHLDAGHGGARGYLAAAGLDGAAMDRAAQRLGPAG
ncbi:MAG: tyrosine-protein phosphatase [Gemmobacter sp.]